MFENIVYEKDYAEERAKRLEGNPKIHEQVFDYIVTSGFFKSYNDAVKALPKYIVPDDKEAYDNLLPRLDKLAKRMGGHIKGIVDYENWESHITVTLPFFEIETEEEHSLLADIAKKAHLFTVTATEDGKVKLSIMINYFNDIGDKDDLISETIMQDDTLVELLMQQHEEEKNFALSDPQIGAFLEKSAPSLGMTAEELYDFLDRACLEHPEIIEDLLSGQAEPKEETENDE